jgi:hypothetical protein
MMCPHPASRRAWLRAAILAAAVPVVARAQDPRATSANRAALDWLAIVDRGDAAASYKATSEIFRGAAEEARWSQALESERAELGALVSRSLVATQFHTELPGLPDKGDYVVLIYRASFAKRDVVSERLTVARDGDGVWRVAGYGVI